jgi:transposase-like protein
MTHDELHTAIRTTLARLELVATASAMGYDKSGGRSCENPGGKRPPGDGFTADQWYRARLKDLDAGHGRRVDGEHGGKVRDTYERLLGDARKELAALTGRTDTAPTKREAPMDTPDGVKAAAKDDAPGKPSSVIARQFGVTEQMALRWYVEWERDPQDGQPLTTEAQDRAGRVGELRAQGYSERQIAMLTGKSKSTVRRKLGKAA